MRNLTKKTRAIVAGAAVIGLVSSGVAYAYWTATGGGTGTATTSAGMLNSFSVVGDVPRPMYPGDSAQTITATVTNNGDAKYKLQKVTAWVTTGNSGCDGSNFLINGVEAPASAPVDLQFFATEFVPTGSEFRTYTIQFNDKATPQDACQSANVTVHYAIA